MMVRPVTVGRSKEGFDRLFLPGRVTPYFAAGTDALVGLDMRAGGNFLQENRDRFRAFNAFEGKGAGGFVVHLITKRCGSERNDKAV
jgi:hypothetical protein